MTSPNVSVRLWRLSIRHLLHIRTSTAPAATLLSDFPLPFGLWQHPAFILHDNKNHLVQDRIFAHQLSSHTDNIRGLAHFCSLPPQHLLYVRPHSVRSRAARRASGDSCRPRSCRGGPRLALLHRGYGSPGPLRTLHGGLLEGLCGGRHCFLRHSGENSLFVFLSSGSTRPLVSPKGFFGGSLRQVPLLHRALW